jgi:probable F420-dependent oxidoreductase
VKIDGGIGHGAAGPAEAARQLEELGYDGALSAEISHDPFIPIALASQSTDRILLGTGIAVAFARNPMLLANLGHDLQDLTKGRFALGLGSQIKPHITKRFSMPWSHPAPRMREMILAVRAIWEAWEHSTPLQFRGEYYTHTLMTPMFDPGPARFGLPPIWLAAVGPVMTEVAGEVADGLVAHAFTTPSYFREVTLASVERGLAKSGRPRNALEISLPLFVVTGRDEAEIAAHAVGARRQLAFYASTPAYRPVLDHHGWGALGDDLNTLSKRGEWVAMGERIDDEVLAEFAVVGPAETLVSSIAARYGGLVDRIQFFAGADESPETWAPVLEGLRAI